MNRPQVIPERQLDMCEGVAWALASIYERAIERSKQKQAAAKGDDENITEGGRAGGPPRIRALQVMVLTEACARLISPDVRES